MGDTVNFSGDFRGGIVNYKSTLTNVRQSIKGIPTTDEAGKEELERLVVDLSQALESLSAKKGDKQKPSHSRRKPWAKKRKKNSLTRRCWASPQMGLSRRPKPSAT